MPQPDLLKIEQSLWNQNIKYIAGIDEAGRGPWVGPVCAAAVIFDQNTHLPEINDSKKLTETKREELFTLICEKSLCYGIGFSSAEEIDEINILQATFKAMKQALSQLSIKPNHLLIDGNKRLKTNIPETPVIKGDSLSQSIAAASILAKVSRDRLMIDLEKKYPQFQFSKHKGYGTKQHQEELKKYGPIPEHRKSFKPVRGYLERYS